MEKKTWRTLVRTLATACFLAGSAAQAAYYSSRWDPPSLDVNAIIEVNCVPNSNDTLVPANNGSGCTASLYSLVATLKENGQPDGYIDFITPAGFRSPSDPGVTDDNYTEIIDGLYFENGNLLGIKWAPLTIFSLFCPWNHSLCPVIGWPPKQENPDFRQFPDDGPWQLMIVNDQSNPLLSTAKLLDWDWHCPSRGLFGLPRCLLPAIEATAPIDFVRRPDGKIVADIRYVGETEPDLDIRGRVVAVPEPGSLALLAGALGAGWITRRRRRNA